MARLTRITPIVKPLKNEWTVHPSRVVRETYKDGRIHAQCGHPREHCPWAGDIPWQTGQMQHRHRNTETVSKTTRRRAWLAGWDKETELMKKAAEDAPRRPAIDEDDV